MYLWFMKVRTSIRLSADLLSRIDELYKKRGHRSELIEKAIRDYLDRLEGKKRDMEDLKILNCKAIKLNCEAEDVLVYQTEG